MVRASMAPSASRGEEFEPAIITRSVIVAGRHRQPRHRRQHARSADKSGLAPGQRHDPRQCRARCVRHWQHPIFAMDYLAQPAAAVIVCRAMLGPLCPPRLSSRGFIHLSPENREKSRSVVQTVAPCSSVIAARTASITSGPVACPSRTRPRKMSQCRSPGSSIPATGWASQEDIAASASDVESGRSNTPALVAILIKAHSVSHAKRTRSCPESAASNQVRLFSCCSAPG